LVKGYEMKFSITTLGCKINQFDAGVLREKLVASGAEVASGGAGADVQVIFTCTVTGKSDYQCRQAIRRAVKDKPEGGRVVVAGCYAETSREAILEIPGVDLVVGNADKDNITSMLSHHTLEAPLSPAPVTGATRAQAMGGRSRAFLRVQEGCDSSCSYCIVPSARGKSRSAPVTEVLEQADKLIGQGYHEIVLTGVHLGSYGRDLEGGIGLPGLVAKLIDRPGLGRLRLSSLEPMEIDDALIELAGSEKLCRHFHVPLQSANDMVLGSMNRGYSADEYFSVIKKLERAAPGACLGADVIVGYPLEDDAAFEETFQRVADSPLNYLHVFSYSPRPGTRAFALGDPVHGDVKKDRSKKLRELAAGKYTEFRKSFFAKDMEVVVEDKDGSTSGLTDNYIRVRFEADGIAPKSKALVRIEDVKEDHCTGVVL
jgi:threonylcarbamoyladenosine tRNA methylthiotransferase MtaB